MTCYELARKLIIKHEGTRKHPYICPAGKISIGVGRNIEDNGLSEEEIDYLLNNDIDRVQQELKQFPFTAKLNGAQKAAIINMLFNLGLPTFKKFNLMIAALNSGDFERAAVEMLNSTWAKQVGARATELANIIRYGRA